MIPRTITPHYPGIMSQINTSARHWPDQHSQNTQRMRYEAGFNLVENPSSISNRRPKELWEESPSPPYSGMSPDYFQARRTTSSSGKRSKQDQSDTRKKMGFTPSKEEKTREIRKKLREQEMLRKRRIVQEQRREESRRALVEEQQQKMKLQWQTKNKMKQEVNHARKRSVDQVQSDWKHSIMVKIMREDEARVRQLGEARDILRRQKDGAYYDKVVGHLRQMEDQIFQNKKEPLPEGPDKVYTELWYRQEKLFRALGERSLQDVKDMLAFTPTILQVKAKKIYQDYPPHRHMQKLLNELVASKITEQFFFKESAELVKKMSPSRIIEHHRRQEASKNGSYRLLKVSSQPAIDRFTIVWSAARLNEEDAKSVAEKVVVSTLRQARSVYSQLMEGSCADLTLLNIGALDELQRRASQQLKEQRDSDTSVGSIGERVHFSDNDIVCPRPLESDQVFSNLKTVINRPPTPIPSEEQVRIASENQQLVDEITLQSEKHLREKMGQERISSGKELSQQLPLSPSLTDTREKLKKCMLEKLDGLRSHKERDGRGLSQIPESAMELIPQMDQTQRESFVQDMSKLVSDIIGSTMKQAETIMYDAIKATEGNVKRNVDGDSEEQADDGADVSHFAEEKTAKMGDKTTDNAKRNGFKPVFGGKDLGLSKDVAVSSLAAISVKHSTDMTGHEGHSHQPPISHMKEFFKNRASMPIMRTSVPVSVGRKRHSMPATLPECMDPTQMHGRHSFLSVMKPDLQILPEYRGKTQRQVEAVLQDHSAFDRLQGASPTISEEDVLHSEEFDASQKSGQQSPAIVETSEVSDKVGDLPADLLGSADRKPPGHTVSMVVQPRKMNAFELDAAPDIPLKMMRSLTASRMLLHCDSDPRLSLRTSVGEISVGIQGHSTHCVDHEAHEESEGELRKLESSALGIVAERTSSTSKMQVHHPPEDVPVRRAGSAEGAPLHVAEGDSDDEAELRVRDPKEEQTATGADPDIAG